MKEQVADRIVWHIKAAIEWFKATSELFPALWDAARDFSPLVLDYCETCRKPRTILWIPVGKHDVCKRLDAQDLFYTDTRD